MIDSDVHSFEMLFFAAVCKLASIQVIFDYFLSLQYWRRLTAFSASASLDDDDSVRKATSPADVLSLHYPSLFCRFQLCSDQGCGAGVVRSRTFLGGVGVGFLTTLGIGVGFFFRLPLRMSDWIIFYITLQNWEFLLKFYNFF